MARKKFTPHLDFYYRNVITKRLDSTNPLSSNFAGLCYAAGWGRELNSDLLDLFCPTHKDWEWIKWEGNSTSFWGSNDPTSKSGVFTDLRQIIVLFMAAMNNEL